MSPGANSHSGPMFLLKTPLRITVTMDEPVLARTLRVTTVSPIAGEVDGMTISENVPSGTFTVIVRLRLALRSSAVSASCMRLDARRPVLTMRRQPKTPTAAMTATHIQNVGPLSGAIDSAIMPHSRKNNTKTAARTT